MTKRTTSVSSNTMTQTTSNFKKTSSQLNSTGILATTLRNKIMIKIPNKEIESSKMIETYEGSITTLKGLQYITIRINFK